MRVHIGNDHAGFDLATDLRVFLSGIGYETVYHGPRSLDPKDDYPPFCVHTAQAVVADQAAGIKTLGVVIGGSGNGEQMAANKVKGARAALVWSLETARLARRHNDANLISLGARLHPLEQLHEMVLVFLQEPFTDQPRHHRRIQMLLDFEKTGKI